MRKRLVSYVLPAAITALTVASVTARAQEPTVASDIPEVTISAPHSVTIGRSTTGAPIQLAQLTFRVGYSDIDITTYSGAEELKNRVYWAAKDACDRLDRQYPYATTEGPGTEGTNCLQEALNSGYAEADQAIAAAEQQRTGATSEAQ